MQLQMIRLPNGPVLNSEAKGNLVVGEGGNPNLNLKTRFSKKFWKPKLKLTPT